MRFSRGIIAVAMVVVGLFSVELSAPAMAHQNGCHAQHSCPSDANPPTYICGDTGNYTYCPGLSGSVYPSGADGSTIGSTVTGSVSWSVAIVGAATYQWYRSGVAIPGAVTSAYTVTQDDIGQALVLTALATDGRGQSASASSTPFVPGYPALPVGRASISPSTATVGTILTAAVGWSRPVVPALQWFRGAAPIPGATSATYTATVADLGQPLSLVASVTEYGRTATVSTATVTPVADVVLKLTGAKSVRAGKKAVLRGKLVTLAGASGRTVVLKAWQKVGHRWVLRAKHEVVASASGAFLVKHATKRTRGDTWRFKGYYAGTSGVRAAQSSYVTIVTR